MQCREAEVKHNTNSLRHPCAGYRLSVPNILRWSVGVGTVWHCVWRYVSVRRGSTSILSNIALIGCEFFTFKSISKSFRQTQKEWQGCGHQSYWQDEIPNQAGEPATEWGGHITGTSLHVHAQCLIKLKTFNIYFRVFSCRLPSLLLVTSSESPPSGHRQLGVHVWDAGAGVRRHGEAAWRHAGDDPVQREKQTARANHKVPRYAGQIQ